MFRQFGSRNLPLGGDSFRIGRQILAAPCIASCDSNPRGEYQPTWRRHQPIFDSENGGQHRSYLRLAVTFGITSDFVIS
jgi:hypothetical protein